MRCITRVYYHTAGPWEKYFCFFPRKVRDNDSLGYYDVWIWLDYVSRRKVGYDWEYTTKEMTKESAQ